ncbi:MAG TPA: PIN domain nuclease [Mycobacteriales bacterium]|nr:PIN domain nuclease [Mycobacteriales bacterium]
MTLLLVDTSIWVEYLRGTSSPAARQLSRLLRERPDDVAVTEPVVMELLAGARPTTVPMLETLVAGLPVLGVHPSFDFPAAAAAYRAARAGGVTVRSLVDCLIAVVAVRHGVELLHRDGDFDVLSDVLADLQVRSLS